jgi:hypothetical protein
MNQHAEAQAATQEPSPDRTGENLIAGDVAAAKLVHPDRLSAAAARYMIVRL